MSVSGIHLQLHINYFSRFILLQHFLWLICTWCLEIQIWHHLWVICWYIMCQLATEQNTNDTKRNIKLVEMTGAEIKKERNKMWKDRKKWEGGTAANQTATQLDLFIFWYLLSFYGQTSNWQTTTELLTRVHCLWKFWERRKRKIKVLGHI